MTYNVQTRNHVAVVADSENPNNGIRITTLELRYPRFIHSEFMTHRVFSRNASSSRAIPVKKMLSQVWNNPAMPIRWGQNIAGMQAGGELTGWRKWTAEKMWRAAGKLACVFAWSMMKVGLHKQWANRILEPWQYISVVVTATEWDNWFALRDHKDAQPEIAALARDMKIAMDKSRPVKRQWHVPYILKSELDDYYAGKVQLETLIKCSVARCARVSYLTHDGQNPDIEKDVALYERLVGSVPIHASPTEHQALAINKKSFIKNFRGWEQHRTQVEAELAKKVRR
jgi:hypothetical protein